MCGLFLRRKIQPFISITYSEGTSRIRNYKETKGINNYCWTFLISFVTN